MAEIYGAGDQPVPGFRLAYVLARGERTTIWKAAGPGGTDAALKIVQLDSSERVREFCSIRLLKHIRHPNLVPMPAFWLKDSQGSLLDETALKKQFSDAEIPGVDHAAELIIAMGLGDQSLADRLEECLQQGLPGLPAEELLAYFEGAARGIDYLNQPIHELGSGPVAIQHCDIKPRNILIVGNAAQICDLGIARVLSDPRNIEVVGSVAYVAPEVLMNNRPSPATDQYALAISYYELRTGHLPFEATSVAGACYVHLKGDLHFTGLSEAEAAVLSRATSLAPDQRFPSCLSMVHALGDAYGSITSTMANRALDGSMATCFYGAKMPEAVHVPEENHESGAVRASSGKNRQRRSGYTVAAALMLATLAGPFVAWMTRGAAPTSRAPEVADMRSANYPETDHPRELSPFMEEAAEMPAPGEVVAVTDTHPFLVASTSQAFASLAEAFAAATDDDTITVHGNGPFLTNPVAAREKALAVKAAPGFHPVFRYAIATSDQALQPLISSDRMLTLEGLELRRDGFGIAPAPTGPAFLVTCDHAPLRLHACTLLVPNGSGAIVCRDPGNIELYHCTLVAYALAVFIEVGEEASCILDLTDNTIDITDPEGAALCFTGSQETCRSGPVRMRLEGNLVRTGRLVGFQRVSQPIDIQAHDNRFTFREALLSYREMLDPHGWRKATTWRGRGNRYVGDDWIHVEGVPVGIRGLQEWQALWGSAEPGSSQAGFNGAFARGQTGGLAGHKELIPWGRLTTPGPD